MFAATISAIVSFNHVAMHVAMADTVSDEQRQRFDLEDQEKQLLRDEDRLKQDVDQLKREIGVRLDKIDTAQRRLARINHDLITLRMKLLP